MLSRSHARAPRGAAPERRSPRADADAARRVTTGKHQRRRPRRAVVLRRGHFKNLDELERPPWPLTLRAEVHEMGMEELDALNPERPQRAFGTDDDADDAPDATGVVVDAEVSPVGHGFFVDGTVRCAAARECDACGRAHVQRVAAPLKAWLDCDAGEDDAAGEFEVVPFPRHREECDLTGLARDLIRMNAPYETLCDACAEASEGEEGGFVFRLEPEDE